MENILKQKFHSFARAMSRVGLGGAGGESKTLAWGFAMGLHRLRALVMKLRLITNVI